MKFAVPAVNRRRLIFLALALGLLIAAVLLACTDEAEDDMSDPETPAAEAGPAAIADASDRASTIGGSSDSVASPSGSDSATADNVSGDNASGDKASGQTGSKSRTVGKPGTQTHSVVSGKSRMRSDQSAKKIISTETESGAKTGKPDTPASISGPAAESATSGVRNAGRSGPADRPADNGSAVTQSGPETGTPVPAGLVAPENPNRALAGITPVPGYLRMTESAGDVASRITVGAAPEIIPGSSGDSGLLVPALKLELAPVKIFRFTWEDIGDETEYRLWEKIGAASDYRRIATLPADSVAHDQRVFLPRRVNARYVLQACNDAGCASSAAVKVSGTLAEAVGYFKASNTGDGDSFGHSVAISGDGKTLAVGAPSEDGAATGVNGKQNSDSASTSGAVYVYARGKGGWIQQAYVKSSNTRAGEEFGYALALSDNGDTLAVGAGRENSSLDRIRGDVDLTKPSGGVYVFVRKGGGWSQQFYTKPSNLADKNAADTFGVSVALSGDGNTLAVGADGEGGDATGVNGGQHSGQAKSSGAVYVFIRRGGGWTQQAYVKSSNTEAGDHFGRAVSLSNDGNTLAVGAVGEDSAATGVNGDQSDNSAVSSGAVYIYTRSGADWTQQAYVKASNNRPGDLMTADQFGASVALSGDGRTLAVGAPFEDGIVAGVNGNQLARSNRSSGAVYVFVRSGDNWAQQAYVKASNTGWGDEFGAAVALSGNGNTLAVGAPFEDSAAVGINGDGNNDTLKSPGAAYVFTRGGGNWFQRAYVKASNNMLVPRDPEHGFGFALALSEAGDALAIGAPQEDGGATGVNGGQSDSFAGASGAVYLY